MMHLFSVKYGLPATPISYQKSPSKAPNRILWPQNGSEQNSMNNNWTCVTDAKLDKEWDDIDSPQYVDFNNSPENSDNTFFDAKSDDRPLKQNSSAQQLPTTDTLIESFRNIVVSQEKEKVSEDTETKNSSKQKRINMKENVEKCVKKGPTLHNRTKNESMKPQRTVVAPFSFDLQDKRRQERKEEHIRKVLEVQSKSTTFRAQPVPKFLKPKIQSTYSGTNNVTTEQVNQKNVEKIVKKPKEVWKKEPFLPCPPKRHLKLPKTPVLLTALRAESRKHFEEQLKEKEKEMEHKQHMEFMFKKKQEQEQIARLRKEAVHKAQPVPKYKFDLPRVPKRPLTDPISPFVLKRRRCT